jgi:hypothetical protein
VGANVTAYTDSGLSAGTTLCYRVRAYNSAGNSAYTPEACKTTPTTSTTGSSFNFSLAHAGDKSVTRGQSVSNVITASLTSGSSQSVSFSTAGFPAGSTASYSSSSSCNPTCSRTLTIATSSSTPTGTYSITVIGSGGGVMKTISFNLTVTSGTVSGTSTSTIAMEAESGTLTAPMMIQSDSTASGGKFVWVPEGTGNNYTDSTNGGPGEVRFPISISQTGTYTLWARTITQGGSSDSFYVTRNGSLAIEWSVPGSTTWKWNKVASLSLAAGNVNIAFRQREDGTKLDQIVLTSDSNFNPNNGTPASTTTSTTTSTTGSTTSGSMITLEAESGSRTAPMVVGNDATASGGKFVEVPEGTGNNYTDSTNGGPGEVRFTINIPKAGTGILWARTIAPNGSSDSFYITTNGSLAIEWHVPGSSTWKWNKAAILSLGAGSVNLAFRQREDGTKLDQIILTSDANFDPNTQ